MLAHPGDWLVVQSRLEGGHVRRGEIIATSTPSGDPPFTVRWVDDGHEAIMFPGPDAHVVTAAHQAEIDAASRGGFAAEGG